MRQFDEMVRLKARPEYIVITTSHNDVGDSIHTGGMYVCRGAWQGCDESKSELCCASSLTNGWLFSLAVTFGAVTLKFHNSDSDCSCLTVSIQG